MECKFCKSKDIILRRDVLSPYVNKKYSLYDCKSCGNLFFDVYEHEIDLQKLYNERAEETSSRFSLEFKTDKTWELEVETIKQMYAKKINSILDVGCRTGDFLMHWGNDIYKMGVELSEYSVRIAKQRGLNVKNEFIENANFDIKFDVVTCYAVLEHLEEPLKFLDTLDKLVKENGVLVIMVPAYHSYKRELMDLFGIRWHMYSPPEHLNFFTEKFISKKLGNFILEKKKYTTGGMMSGIVDILILKKIIRRLFYYRDKYSPFLKYAIFDHMYLYYRKK